MDTRTQSLTLQSKLKTCAILHFKFKGKPRIAKFYWGSLLDFPEYRIGDVIRWSNYSIGESDIVETVHARAYIDGAHHHELVIHIHQNTIISCEILADRLQHHGVKPFAYIGDERLPWLVMPDKYFINSHRTDEPGQMFYHSTQAEQYANVY